MEGKIRSRIERSPDPVATALAYARIGNYIDFCAMNHVDKSTFLSLLNGATLELRDWDAYMKFTELCRPASSFLLTADSCGEIVLDKLFLEQMLKAFPNLNFTVMVRGSEVLNDATTEDAEHAGIVALARIVSNGTSVAGTVYSMLSDDARIAMDSADVILAKGQGNYELLCGQGRKIFYSLLCKCEWFTERFQVPALTGILQKINEFNAYKSGREGWNGQLQGAGPTKNP